LLGGVLAAQDAQRYPADHADRGLPRAEALWQALDAAPDHPANRVFAAIYLDRCVPAEVATALPREHGDPATYFAKDWYFGKRKGTAADERLFGGDGRQMPREGFAEAASAAFASDLASIDGGVLAGIRKDPRMAVYLQNDLLRLVRRLLDTEQNPELLAPLLACAARLSFSAEELSRLGPVFALADLAPRVPGLKPERCVELERRSSRLFDAQYSLAWSKVYVQWSEGDAAQFAAWLAAGEDKKAVRSAVPIGTMAVLVQGLVAMDDQGKPCATPVVTDVRVQRLSNRDPLSLDNKTTTRDGVDFRLWQLPRQTLRTRAAATSFADFRELDTEDQELFRDYGTRKHTTIFGQCSLCHRRSNGPDEELAGFSVLRPSSKPRPVADAGERLRRAEGEFAKFLAEARKSAK
jgi:hypothetical protein